MKLVIDIPEGLYNNIQKDCGIYPYRLVYDAMKNGTPLPTDAVDRVTIKEYLESFGTAYELGKEKGLDIALDILDKYTEEGNEKIIRDLPSVTPQPCDDCISRQAVLDINERYCGEMPGYVNHEIWKEIKVLQSVTPHQKMVRWIEHFDESGKWYECDQCHTDWGGYVNYCPNCGAKMQEVEE